MIPEIERRSRRSQAQRQYGQPRCPAGRPDGALEGQMAGEREQGRCGAEGGDRIGRRFAEAARQNGVDRPGEGAAQCQQVAQRVAVGEVQPAAEGQQRHAREAQGGAGQMRPAQTFARQRRGEQHDQQRPEIVDEVGFGRWRELKGGEIEGVVAEQAADPQQPDARRPADQSGPPHAARKRAHDADRGADREGHGDHLEGRDRAGQHREEGERTPQGNGDQARRHGLAPDAGVGRHRRRIENEAAIVERMRRTLFASTMRLQRSLDVR